MGARIKILREFSYGNLSCGERIEHRAGWAFTVGSQGTRSLFQAGTKSRGLARLGSQALRNLRYRAIRASVTFFEQSPAQGSREAKAYPASCRLPVNFFEVEPKRLCVVCIVYR